MTKTPSDHLLDSLEELVPYEFEKFKFKLQNTSLEKDHRRIPRGLVQMARPVKLATLMVNHYGEEDAVRLTLQVLRAINQRLLAEELHKATGQDATPREGGTSSPAGSCSSEEDKPKSLKAPGSQEGEGAASLQSGQPQAGRGPQKKCQDRRRDQSLDGQGKPGARSMTLPSRKGPSLPVGRLPGEKGCTSSPSSSLRRNANSTSKLQDLSSCSLSGSLGRRHSKRTEGKQRPRSLELTFSSGEKGPLNPETLLTLQEMKIVSPDPIATPRAVATVDFEGLVAPGEASRSPERPMKQEGRAFRNTLTSVPLTAGEETPEHREPTAPSGEKQTRSPEAPGTLREPLDPEAPPSLGRKGPQNPEQLRLSLGLEACEGRPQERDPVDSTCVHDSSRCSEKQGALGSCSLSCPQGQVLLPKQQPGSLSPGSPPQCERHMKQLCLLFCEDHQKPVCLICSLSQEHRGHQLHPIEEAALDYQDQIHWQLEHLKELRKSGEEQKHQGDKETANFLKQIEAQKQKVRCQMRQLCHFLEKQEQLFVAWLEDLGQTIHQVGDKYGRRVSQDITVLNELIGELEAKQCQSVWELMQDIGVTLHRAKMVTIPEPWVTPSEVKEKMHLFYSKSEFIEKSIKRFSESLRSGMEAFIAPELLAVQAHAVDVVLDAETAHPNLTFSNDLKSVRLGKKGDRLPEGPETFDSCILALGSPTFCSGRQYWEVEVGDKTAWVLGVCKVSMSRKGSMTLSPENGYWVVMMTMRNEYQACTFPPTRLWVKNPPRRVGIFLDYEAGDISFYNVTAKSHMYTFTCCSPSEPLQPIFSPGKDDGGKNADPLTICVVRAQEPH
ncbi:pyrin [Orycteropus afer afer]|uniref:Pyrin n=1 Tax=Orycteropus afer afer TaxID=1230840 RepID=A0A8B6ZVA6_ORYAF|nr:pyrin [Orycteropus afer afer]